MGQQYETRWDYKGVRTDKTLTNIMTNLDEIIKLCKEININISSSIENLSSEILRDAFMAVPELLNFLIYHMNSLRYLMSGR